MRLFFVLLVLVALPCGSCQDQPSGKVPVSKFDGKWWSTADADERSGFIEGLSDCMTWTAHKRGYSETAQQLSGKITNFYSTHKNETDLSVLDAWQKTMRAAAPSPTATEEADSGEKWSNAHWYLNGDWWAQVGRSEQIGFVEASLWCRNTQVKDGGEGYSRSTDYYVSKIDAFVRANPKLGREAVAVTLERFAQK